MRWILTVFIAFPIVELWVLLEVGSLIGFWRTVGVILITAVVGASMWRSQGLKILWEIRDELRREELPANSLIEGLLILVGGAFLVTPGFVTDGIGFVFLIPFTRRYLRSSLKSWVKQKIEKGEIDVYVHFDGNGLPGA